MVTSHSEAAQERLMADAGRALFRLGRAFARMPRRDLLDAGSGRYPDLSTILVVQAVADAEAAGEEVTVGALAERLGVDPSTASRLVAQAVRTWRLRRVASVSDGRVVALALTDAGHELDVEAARYQRSVFDEATRGWSEADRTTFARLFVRFAGDVTDMLALSRHQQAGTGVMEEMERGDGSRALSVVATWHAALNAGNPDLLVTFTHPDVEMSGPKGDAVGQNLLHDWATHAGIRLEPLRWFRRADRIVVEQHAAWRDPGTGAFGEPMVVATAFGIDEGLVRRIARYPDLAEALRATGLDDADELPGDRTPIA